VLVDSCPEPMPQEVVEVLNPAQVALKQASRLQQVAEVLLKPAP